MKIAKLRGPTPRINQRRLIAAAFVLLLSAGAGCSGSESEASSTKETPPVPVETLVVGSSNFVERVEVSGIAQPIREVTVAAEAPGRVLSAAFEEGANVEKGAMLIRVDSQSDSARVDVLRNQLAAAKREYERTKMLTREGLATPQQLDQASSSVDASNLAIRQARVGIGKTTVRSPQSGIVATKYLEEGEYAAPGAPIAHIVDYSIVVIEAAVPESVVPFVTAGREVDVFLPSLDRKVSGVIKRRAIVATAKTRTYPVEVHVPNQDFSILPGMRARVIIPRKTWSNVVVVPRDTILQGYEAREAMVLPAGSDIGEAELRLVELGPARGNRVVVTSGLSVGDRLIVKGHRGIVRGTRVKTVRQHTPEHATPDAAPAGESAAKADTPANSAN